MAAREGAGVTEQQEGPTWGQHKAVGLAYVTARHLDQGIRVNVDQLLKPFCCCSCACCCSKAT